MSEQSESESTTNTRPDATDIAGENAIASSDVSTQNKITPSVETVVGNINEERSAPDSGATVHDRTTGHGTVQQQILARLRDPMWQGIGVVVAILGLAFSLWAFSWSGVTAPNATPPPDRMSGDFRVAVASFSIDGQPPDSSLDPGKELAQGVFLNLQSAFQDLRQEFQITIWGPDVVGAIQGVTAAERAKSVRAIAERIGADVVVYGVIDVSEPGWSLKPEFYISDTSVRNVHEVADVVGDHEMGKAIPLPGQNDVASRVQLSSNMKSRLQALAKIVIGLAYYSLRDYPKALEVYQSADSIDGWASDQGKNVLYLLIGNAAGRQGNSDLAEEYFQKSLAVDPDYARPYVGLGSVYYLRALKPFDASKKPADTDQGWLDKSIETYQRALVAPIQPAMADVSTKVHFGLGQAYLMRAYSGHAATFDAAVAEFQQVIGAYANGVNPRVKEWAAESHARLGLIYDLSGHVEESISEYETAASLLSDDPDRSTQYYQRAQSLKHSLITPTP